MKFYLFLTFAIGGSYPHHKGCELANAYLSPALIAAHASAIFSISTLSAYSFEFALCLLMLD